ncbi:MAG: tetratricopeptide repeat protein, partial [Planctomycetota bacterium]
IVRQTEVGNDVQAADAMIDSLETLTEGQKNLRKHRLRVALGQLDEAAPFLDAARETEGDTPAFLLAAFEYALATNDLDEARAIIAQSADRDIDGADGLTLRARLNIAEGSLDEAERALATAVERGSLNPTTFGLLGRVRSLQGDAAGAIDAFGRAREIRPDSVEHIVNYCRALAAAGRQTDALEAARSSLDVARTSPEFRQIWLALEGTVGSKQTAYDERVAVAEAEPDNEDNTAALIQLCIDLGRFDEARDRLDAARAERDTLTLCRLDALWHTQRGDLQAASQQYQQFLISDAEGANSASAYIAFGTFLIDYGQLDAGLTTLRQGRRVQPADNPIVDRVLATRLFQAGRYQQAVEVLGPLVDAEDQGGDERVRSLLIESLVRLDQWDAAETRIAQLPEDEQELLVTRLLRVEIARGRGNDAEARRILDEAIAAFPDEALPYVRRATLLMADEALLSDAAEDLTRAIELDPTSVEALRFRSVVLNRLGREDQAIEDIIAASRARPLDDQTRFAAATRLTELGREDLAADLVDEGLELQPGNLRLLMNGGRLFASRDNHRRAVQYLERAWEQSKDVNVASPLVNSMLEMPRPNLRAARQVVTDPQLDQESPAVLLLQARIESAAEDMRATESLLTEIYLSSRNDPQVLVGWGAALSELLGGDAEAAAYLRRLDARETLSPWGRFTQARTLSADESGTSEALDIVTSLVESPPDANLGLAALRLRSIIHYNAEDYESAAADMRRGLEIVPDDAELHNNLAYTLSEHMDKPAEALPLAVRAVELSPMNRGMLDTLGTVYISAGQPENAFEPLERALALATTDAGRVSAMVLLARAQLETGNLPGASDTASDARRIIDRIDEPDEDTQRELDSVLEDIQQRR